MQQPNGYARAGMGFFQGNNGLNRFQQQQQQQSNNRSGSWQAPPQPFQRQQNSTFQPPQNPRSASVQNAPVLNAPSVGQIAGSGVQARLGPARAPITAPKSDNTRAPVLLRPGKERTPPVKQGMPSIPLCITVG